MRIRLYILSAWSILDPLYYSFTRLQYLKTKEQPTIFRVRLTRYKGREVVLSDGTMIKKNDVLVKIHLHNVQLLKELLTVNNDLRKSMILYKRVKESLPHLASYVYQHKDADEIKGIIGITLLNKGCTRLGFEIFTILNPTYNRFKQLALFPIYFISTTKRSTKGQKIPSPNYLFMSKKSLLKKYGNI
ncbi:MAG: YkoP family protein [Bacillota bacterium]